MTKPRLRFAPSPTGSLHVGGARTALYNYAFAKHFGGEFILRLEDTDQERSTDQSAESMMQDLSWLGLNADEGVMADLSEQGEFGPYRQSQRLDIYRQYIDQLLQDGRAYYCFLDDENIDAQKEQAKALGQTYRPTSEYRTKPISEALARIAEGELATIRFKIDDTQEEYHVPDLIRGQVTLPAHMVGDFVLLRSDGMPVYNFACVVDDHLMGITHVFRGEEHLSNTLKQMMLYQAFDWELPQFGHLSIILDEHRKKLSKRHASASCLELRNQGYLPSSVNNALALLGWSHPEAKEIFSMSELIEAFSVERIHASSAAYDLDKLKWINRQYIKDLSIEVLGEHIKPWVPETWRADPRCETIVKLFQLELDCFSDITHFFDYFSDDFSMEEEAISFLKSLPDLNVIDQWLETIDAEEILTAQQYKTWVDQISKQTERRGKQLFMPIRIAMTGRMQGPELPLLLPLYAKDLLLKRGRECQEIYRR